MNSLVITNKDILKNQTREIDVIESIVLIIVLLRFCYPLDAILGKFGGYISYYAMFFLFLLLCSFFVRGYAYNFLKYNSIPIIFIIGITLRSLLSGNISLGFFDPLKTTISIANIIVAISIYLYIRDRSDLFKRKILIITLISMIVSIIYSLYYVTFIDYLAVRNETRVDIGVGDFSLVYSVPFLSIILISVYKYNYKKYKFTNIFILLLVLISFLFVLKANFMTALLLLILTIILSFFKMNKSQLLLMILIFSGVIIYLESIGNLFYYLANLDMFSWVLKEKLYALGNLFTGSNTDLDTMGIRMEKIKSTLNTFIANPFIGVNYENYNETTVGGHAQWFDDLARYGLLGFSLWIVFYIKVFRDMVKYSKFKVEREAIKKSAIIFIILGFLNPNTMSTVTMLVFSIIPFIGSLGSYKNRKV